MERWGWRGRVVLRVLVVRWVVDVGSGLRQIRLRPVIVFCFSGPFLTPTLRSERALQSIIGLYLCSALSSKYRNN